MKRYFSNSVFLLALFAFSLAPSVSRLSAQLQDAAAENVTGADLECRSFVCPQSHLDWADWEGPYDNGYEDSVAMHSSGLIIDVHASGATRITYTGLYYRLGKFDAASGTVSWGPSRTWVDAGTAGSWPSAAITREGYVILTYSNAFNKSGSTLRYSVGTLDPNGSNSQQIQFKLKDQQFDKGFHDSIAVNSYGTIAEAHEADGKTGLWYRLGYLNAPGSGDFKIVWKTGDRGVQYDDGINPHIAINDNNDAIEVHQVTGENLLHYTRGRIVNDRITFTDVHPPYMGGSMRPSVILLNNGHVIEIHASNQQKSGYWEIRYRTGVLDPNRATHIQWSPTTGFTGGYADYAGGLCTDGNYAVATAVRGGKLYYNWTVVP
jgi:hypothetical protein